MQPKISLITLGVYDLPRATRFYRDGLFLPEHETDSDEVAFFKLEGTWLSLFLREALAKDIGIEDNAPIALAVLPLHTMLVAKMPLIRCLNKRLPPVPSSSNLGKKCSGVVIPVTFATQKGTIGKSPTIRLWI